jgi:hypothetical protein
VKITLIDPTTFVSDASAVSQITTNNDVIEAAIENTLSRDGTAPNQMGADFDMNSHRILNLPRATSPLEPVRLQEVGDAPQFAANASESAATALANRILSDVDVVLTHADVVLTHADAATTAGLQAAAAASAVSAAANATVVTGLKYLFTSSTSMADPGSGAVRLNNAALGSVTAIAINANSADTGAPNVSAFITTWDASTNSVRATLLIRKIGAPDIFRIYSVNGATTNNTTWLQLAVSHVSGNGSFSSSDPLTIQFYRTGDKGADGTMSGPGSSVDGEIALYNGSGGTTLKRSGTSGLLKATSGVLSAATSNTDFCAATTGSSVLKGSSGGTTPATPGTDFVKPDTASAFTKQQSFTLSALTDAATINWDVSSAQKTKVTLGGNRTMAAVTNAVEGASYFIWVIQDGTGSRTITWTTSGAGSFDFGVDGVPTLTTTASKADLLCFEAISIGGTLKLRHAGIKKGFA